MFVFFLNFNYLESRASFCILSPDFVKKQYEVFPWVFCMVHVANKTLSRLGLKFMKIGLKRCVLDFFCGIQDSAW